MKYSLRQQVMWLKQNIGIRLNFPTGNIIYNLGQASYFVSAILSLFLKIVIIILPTGLLGELNDSMGKMLALNW